jgi:DNA-binding NarL/FixJ family response regulator
MPKRILIVDDNGGVRHRVRTHLEMQPGFAICEEATDGVEAIERAEESKPDLIVLGLDIPRMNGLEATPESISHGIPIILLTSTKDVIPEHRFRHVGISSVLPKTCPIEVLLKEVHRLIGAGRSISAKNGFAFTESSR